MTTHAYPTYFHKLKDGKQTEVWSVWIEGVLRIVWITYDLAWWRREGSINDLKAMAMAECRA